MIQVKDMSTFSEQKLFSVCLEQEKKQMILKAIDSQLDVLVDNQYSEKTTQRYMWLKEEIGKMSVCTNSD
jgi:hypothetical protein